METPAHCFWVMAGEWPDEYLEFKLTSSPRQNEERELQCTPVPHTLHWRDFSLMLESLYIPDWLKKEAEKGEIYDYLMVVL